MAPLRGALEQAGLAGVRTYIQTGNIVAASSLSQPALEQLVHDVIAEQFSGDIVVLARTAQQFHAIQARNPFPNADPAQLYVTLLAATPAERNAVSQEPVATLIAAIEPLDPLEAAHQVDALAWVCSGAPLYRTRKPATPPKHLVVYLALFDPAVRKLLLVDHRNAGLWLPPGGHVDPGEHPRETARREAWEELSLQADFLSERPAFLTVTTTVGADAGHTDVTLWYLLRGDSATPLAADQSEFHALAWFELSALPHPRTEPHLARFAQKLRQQCT